MALLLFLTGTTAMAQSVAKPQVSTAAEKHYYTFANANYAAYYVVSQNIRNQAYFKSSNVEPAARFTFEQVYDESNNAVEDTYYIKSARFNAYVSHAGLAIDGGLKYSANAGDTEKWVLIRKNAESETDLSVAVVTYASKDADNRLGWNPHGGETGNICLWNANATGNDASFWNMTEVEVTEPTFTPLTSLDDFTDGWYQLKTAVSYKREPLATGKYMSCIPSGDWNFTLDGLGARPATFVYISKDGDNYHLMGPSGRYGQHNVTKGVEPADLTLTQPDEDKSMVKIGGGDHVWAGWLWNNIFIVGSSSNTESTDENVHTRYCRFQISKVDDFLNTHYDVYTVTVTGFSDNPQVPVVYNHAGYEGVRTVYNGGAFFIEKGTTVTAADFSVAGDVCDIVVSSDTKTITVSLRPSVMANADAVMTKLGKVGYPAEASEAMTTAYNNAVETPSYAHMTALKTQYTTWFTTENMRNVVLPESGKAYTIVFRPTDKENGTYRYLNFTGSGLNTVAMADKDSDVPASGVFVFRKNADKYSIVPAYGTEFGHYLAYQSAPATYTSGVNDCVVGSLVGFSGGTINDRSVDNLAGYMYILFDKRVSTDPYDDNKRGVYIINMSTGNFDFSYAPFLNASYTSALIIREVENYPGSVTLNAAEGVDGVDGIGTFSAPYAAVVPEGVTAYYVKETAEANGESWARMEALPEGEVIPAGTGVLLTGAAGTQALMVPAIGETRATVEGNLLGQSAGADKAIATTEDAYILTKKNDVVGFYPLNSTSRTLKMNKSYLSLPAALGVQQIKMDFGNSTTGIAPVVPAADTAAPVYDLSGRRVTAPVKGGVYIKAGKKFIMR